MILSRSPKPMITQALHALFRARKVFTGLAIIAFGALLGYLFSLSREANELTISVLVLVTLMVITISRPLNGLLTLLAFHAFVESWIEIPLGAGVPDLSFGRFAIAFLVVFMLAQAAIAKFRFAPISLTDVCIVLVPIGVAISAPLSVNPITVLQEAITIHFGTLSMYFLAKNLVRDKDDLRKLLLVIAIVGLLVSMYVIYEVKTGNVWFVSKGRQVGHNLYRSDSGIRIIKGLLSTGGNGRALALAIPITFYLFFEHKKVGWRIFLVGILAVQFYGLLLTYNRTSWYSLLISLFVLQFFYPQFRKVFLALVLVSVMVLWATWDQVNESQAADRVNDENSTLEGREERWKAGFNMWKVEPIRGWGTGRYERESGRFRTDGLKKNFRAIENDYLDIMVNSGLIGFLPYLIFLLVPLVSSVRLFLRARSPGWAGSIKPETIAVYWCIMIPFLVGSYTAVQNGDVVKMFTFAVAGAVVGSHEHLLRITKTASRQRHHIQST